MTRPGAGWATEQPDDALRRCVAVAAPSVALAVWGLASLTRAAGSTGLDLTGAGTSPGPSLLVVVPALTAPLLARRRHAGAVFAAVVALFAARVAGGWPPSAADFAVLVAAFAVGRYGRRHDVLTASAVSLVALAVAATPGPSASPAALLGLAIGCLLAPAGLGVLCRPAGAAPSPAAAAPDPLAALSRREREVLELMARGWSNRRIADHLHVEVSTVKSHVRRVLKVLGVRNRVEAAAALAGVPREAERPH